MSSVQNNNNNNKKKKRDQAERNALSLMIIVTQRLNLKL